MISKDKDVKIRNALIHKVTLGYEDHGILSGALHLDYGDSGQAFGYWELDQYNKDAERRIPTTACGSFIAGVLKTLDVRMWEDLPGKYVRAEVVDGLVKGIGHILKDQWFRPVQDIIWDSW